MRIGILTGGGDCSCLNAAIHGVASSLMNNDNAEVIAIEDSFLGLLERRTRPLTKQDLVGLMRESGTILGTSNKATPFNYEGQNCEAEVMAYCEELGLDGIVALGGDGTMSLCHGLSHHGLKFVGIPKTIDNDLANTDRSFGFDTASHIVAEAIDRLHSTGRSHQRVMILEAMGRYSGWIALYGGVAGEADIILLPEHPYDLEEVARIVQERELQRKHTIIVVAEGALPRGGKQVIRETVKDSPDRVRLGGIGKFLQEQLERRVTSEIRTTVLGHLQRGGPPTAFDRVLATNLGCYAARLVRDNQWGRMACIKDNQFSSVPLEEVANKNRTIPDDEATLLGALECGISFGDGALLERLHKAADGPLKMC